MDSTLPFIVDPYVLLDNRTRERLIPAAAAPAGRYLSLDHDGETKLIALERPITHIGRGLAAATERACSTTAATTARLSTDAVSPSSS
jgi:hypothetical protein